MEKQSKIAAIILGFMVVILATVIVTVVATQVGTNTSPTRIENEVLDITAARLPSNSINETYQFTLSQLGFADAGGWVTNSVYISNATQSLAGNFTVNYATQKITFINNTYMVTGGGKNTNSTLVDYSYYATSYINSSFGRNILNMIPGFIALMTLIGLVALLYIFLNETN